MTTDATLATAAPPDLQFDRAVFGADAPTTFTCALCEQAITGSYYDVNARATCPSCHDQLVAANGVDLGMRGVLAAIGAGIGAGVLGALLYYAVLAISGYEIGLIAIAVGLMVGHAVKWGSGGRGGRRFQILAVTLTYVAIVSTYVPFIIEGISEANSKPAGAIAPATPGTTPSPVAPAAEAQPMSAGQAMVALGIFAMFLLAVPFLGGLQNAIGLLIIGFALWEAWKVNRRVVLTVSGPFSVEQTTLPPPPIPTAPTPA